MLYLLTTAAAYGSPPERVIGPRFARTRWRGTTAIGSMSFRIPFRALQRGAAVDHQNLSGDIPRIVREQEFRRLSDVPAGALELQHRGLGALRARRIAHAAG